jgi:alkanesulfonate monooxygenase SsuD/methylene tetrahydromethanopterin reductase-like flavin-dependent oxidoreductase (luciferase family)
MKFGPGLPTGMEGLINPIPFFAPSDFVRAGREAERLGYDSIWGNDHYAPQEYVRSHFSEAPSFYEVLTVLTAVAASTTRLEVGTAVLVLPMRDAALVAKQVFTLDQLSGGRVMLGVGIGAYREEYAAARPDLVGEEVVRPYRRAHGIAEPRDAVLADRVGVRSAGLGLAPPHI